MIENGDVLYISCGEDFLLSGSKVGPAPASPALICRTAEPPEHQSDKLPTSAPPNRGDQWTDIVGLTRTAQKEPKARRFLDLAPSLLTVLKQVHPTLGLSDGAASMVSSVLNYCVDCLVDELGLAAQLKAAALPPGHPPGYTPGGRRAPPPGFPPTAAAAAATAAKGGASTGLTKYLQNEHLDWDYRMDD